MQYLQLINDFLKETRSHGRFCVARLTKLFTEVFLYRAPQ